jgi:hypothetical protein
MNSISKCPWDTLLLDELGLPQLTHARAGTMPQNNSAGAYGGKTIAAAQADVAASTCTLCAKPLEAGDAVCKVKVRGTMWGARPSVQLHGILPEAEV